MRERLFSSVRPTTRRATLAIDVVPLSPREGELAVLLLRGMDPRTRERWMLPWDAPRDVETLDEGAQRIARAALGAAPALVEQVAAYGDGRRHPGEAEISVGFTALVRLGAPLPEDPEAAHWFRLKEIPALAPRHRAVIDGAVEALRLRLDVAPVAFHLLPPAFTLTELQAIYELLLGRRLHKASFRRALQAAFLVEPLDEWRSEGRGRPAQLFRYSPRKRRGARRGVRFDLL